MVFPWFSINFYVLPTSRLGLPGLPTFAEEAQACGAQGDGLGVWNPVDTAVLKMLGDRYISIIYIYIIYIIYIYIDIDIYIYI